MKGYQFFVLTILSSLSSILGSPPKLIIISMDGFKYDYLDLMQESEITNFRQFITNGVKSELINVFPTVTYPNHYTLITGLYPESHGLVHNRFYDPSPDVMSYFLYDNRRDNYDPVWYDVGAEPIYVTNKKAGLDRYSGSVLWPCGLGKVKEIAPDKIIPNADPFNHTDFEKRVDYLVNWFTSDTHPINLGLLYFDEPDETAHKYGAGSEEVKKLIRKLDTVLGSLIKKLKGAGIFDDMNIIVTADHGFTNATESIALADYGIVSPRDYTTGTEKFLNHITVQMFPTNKTDLLQKLEKVSREALKDKLFVYEKDKSVYLKETLHFNSNVRVAPIVITGNEGITIFKDKEAMKNFTTKGLHGFDPHKYRSMHPIFLAMGPAFKKGVSAKPFNSVDIYPLMCYILGLTPAPNNGSVDGVMNFLIPRDTIEDAFAQTGISFLLLVGLTVMIAGLYAICACHNARRKPRLLRSMQRPFGVAGLPTHHLLESDGDDDEF